jgi:hypothetical protein
LRTAAERARVDDLGCRRTHRFDVG